MFCLPIIVLPAKHGRHIGSCLRRRRQPPRCHDFCFRSINFEGMHQFHSKFTEG